MLEMADRELHTSWHKDVHLVAEDLKRDEYVVHLAGVREPLGSGHNGILAVTNLRLLLLYRKLIRGWNLYSYYYTEVDSASAEGTTLSFGYVGNTIKLEIPLRAQAGNQAKTIADYVRSRI